jgi:amino acid transporter
MYMIIFALTIRGYFWPSANVPGLIAVTTLVFTVINFRGIPEALKLITVASEEIVNPGKTIPRAILITLGVGIAIYVLVVFVMMGAVNYRFGSTDIVKSAASLSDFGYLMGVGAVNYAVIALHKKMSTLRRPFKVAPFPYVSILGVLSCWLFVPALEAGSSLLGGLLTLLGGIIYLMRRANRAELRQLN